MGVTVCSDVPGGRGIGGGGCVRVCMCGCDCVGVWV